VKHPSAQGRVLAAGVALLVAACGCSRGGRPPAGDEASPVPVTDLADALEAQLSARERPLFVTRDDDAGLHLWKAVQRLYKRRSQQPAWFSAGRPRKEAAELIEAAGKAGLDGLDPAAYDLAAAKALVERLSSRNPLKRESADPGKAAQAELQLSYVFMKYASHLLSGRVDPYEIDANWAGHRRHTDLPDLLLSAVSGRGVTATLESLMPRHPQYALLKAALPRYHAIAARGGWPTDLPSDLRLRRGDKGPAVARLRARLEASGDLAGSARGATPARLAAEGDSFDQALAAAVQRVEHRHGLEADGAVDGKTVEALNVPAERRIRQIELNLERWRWLPEDLGARHVIVNVPTFRLQAFEHGKPVLEMRIVAGDEKHPTPIFSDRMTHIVFSPFWNIPPGIAREEWIPELERDPNYLRKYGIEIVKGDLVLDPTEVDWNDEGLRLRQRPGVKNSLGLVKFAFPNRYNVYLHDTPFDGDFERVARSFSHGCVRVEKPTELALWMLRGREEWTPARIDAAMHAGKEQQVKIAPPIPVYLIYQTAWAADDSTIAFAADLYGHDSRQLGLLDRGPH
jgi:murein L,D-transpeptidase YcbB/YkuD